MQPSSEIETMLLQELRGADEALPLGLVGSIISLLGFTPAVAGLAALFAPLAILPAIQFGTSEQEDARCGELLRQA